MRRAQGKGKGAREGPGAGTAPAVGSVVMEGPVAPASIVRLVRDGLMDAELAALASMTIEAGIPVVVAGELPAPGERSAMPSLTCCCPPPGP